MQQTDYGGVKVFNILEFIKRVIKVFTKSDISRIIGREIAIPDEVMGNIKKWNDMYIGKACWVDDYIKSIGLEKGICREFADCTLCELESQVSNDKLNEMYQKSLVMLNENLQTGLALGSFCLKPIGEDKAEFVTADKFIPLSFSSDGKPDCIVFISNKRVSDNSFYRRFELHEIVNGKLHITNKAFYTHSGSELGTECNLNEVYEWANLEPDVYYDIDRMDFGFYRNPIKNNSDDKFFGVSVFDSAIEMIKCADTQFARLKWEYESGERAINVDSTALENTSKGAPKLNKRLYRGLNISSGIDNELYKEWSPQFRDENIINGLEQMKRSIEFSVGLAYGDLSAEQTKFNDSKTATEIRHTKQRKYNRINAIETNLKDCLEDFVFGLAFYNKLTTSGYEFTCNFKDSILTDEQTEREQDIKDISIGALPLWKYIMKWQGLSEEEAKAQALEGSDNTVLE